MNKSNFGRKRDEKQLLLRNLATAVILYESVTTTTAKGRVIQPIVDRLIAIGLTDDPLTARRKLQSYLTDKNAVNKILNELANRYKGIHSGFTRRFAIPARLGDGAPQAIIQLTHTVLLTDAKDKKVPSPQEKVKAAPNEASHETNA